MDTLSFLKEGGHEPDVTAQSRLRRLTIVISTLDNVHHGDLPDAWMAGSGGIAGRF
jgi:hypothetical protein